MTNIYHLVMGITRADSSYMLRIMQRNPDHFTMERIGQYIQEFAKLLGTENQPKFCGIHKQSTGFEGCVSPSRYSNTKARLVGAKEGSNVSAKKILNKLEAMLSDDKIEEAKLLDADDRLIYEFVCRPVHNEVKISVLHEGSWDGVIVGIQGIDNSSHIKIKDDSGRVISVETSDSSLARQLASEFKAGWLRLYLKGVWERTDDGWLPESSKCKVLSFEKLDEAPLTEIFSRISLVPGNGWATMKNPLDFWHDLRNGE